MRDLINGLGVSTQLTPDCGYETAILDKHNTYPVERYQTQEESVEGHKRWVEWAKGDEVKITKLGWVVGGKSLVPETEIIIERVSEEYIFERPEGE